MRKKELKDSKVLQPPFPYIQIAKIEPLIILHNSGS